MQSWNIILLNVPELSRVFVKFQPLSTSCVVIVLLESVKLSIVNPVKSGLGLIVLSKYTPSSDMFGPNMYDPFSTHGVGNGVGTKNVTANVCGVAA